MERWHCPPDTGFEIRALTVWGRARYLSGTEVPHNTEFYEWMWFQTAETGKRTLNCSVKGRVLTTTLGLPPFTIQRPETECIKMLSQRPRRRPNIEQILSTRCGLGVVECWANVVDAGPALQSPWINGSCFLGRGQPTEDDLPTRFCFIFGRRCRRWPSIKKTLGERIFCLLSDFPAQSFLCHHGHYEVDVFPRGVTVCS